MKNTCEKRRFFCCRISYSLTLVAVFELFSGRCVFFRERTMPTMALRAVGALLQLRERITVHSRAPTLQRPNVKFKALKMPSGGPLFKKLIHPLALDSTSKTPPAPPGEVVSAFFCFSFLFWGAFLTRCGLLFLFGSGLCRIPRSPGFLALQHSRPYL